MSTLSKNFQVEEKNSKFTNRYLTSDELKDIVEGTLYIRPNRTPPVDGEDEKKFPVEDVIPKASSTCGIISSKIQEQIRKKIMLQLSTFKIVFRTDGRKNPIPMIKFFINRAFFESKVQPGF